MLRVPPTPTAFVQLATSQLDEGGVSYVSGSPDAGRGALTAPRLPKGHELAGLFVP